MYSCFFTWPPAWHVSAICTCPCTSSYAGIDRNVRFGEKPLFLRMLELLAETDALLVIYDRRIDVLWSSMSEEH